MHKPTQELIDEINAGLRSFNDCGFRLCVEYQTNDMWCLVDHGTVIQECATFAGLLAMIALDSAFYNEPKP